jgi:hypothetical protein
VPEVTHAAPVGDGGELVSVGVGALVSGGVGALVSGGVGALVSVGVGDELAVARDLLWHRR